jgi:polyferredoxin
MGRLIIILVLTVTCVIMFSHLSNHLWAGQKGEKSGKIEITAIDNMSVAQFGQKYDLANPVLKKIFNLSSPSDLQKQVIDFGMTREQLNKKVNQVMAIEGEKSSKNWIKILLKFSLWILYLLIVFVFLKKERINVRNRKWIYAGAVVIFGIILGSDPSPMGTVKDAIVLFATNRVVFIPRLIAFSGFILMVVLANKFICSWGCQIGVLQDFIFRLNRDKKDQKGLFHQIKIPFLISNSIRILFFTVFVLIAFLWALDIISFIDPFKIYKPVEISIIGGLFLGLMLIPSLFVYRPWCTFFCPFGLAGWLAEKISIFHIKVDYNKCISCQLCTKVCPTTVMSAILKQDTIKPDCFSCGDCIESCPVNAISFSIGKTPKPPEGKFSK